LFEKQMKERLLLQQQSGLYRNPPLVERREGKYVLVEGRRMLSFASNDYLGLAETQELREIVAAHFSAFGTSSSSSRLVSGNYSAIAAAEKEYAGFFGYDQALFFPSGYQANIGLISGLFDYGDTILFDKHVHASSVKGMSLSRAAFFGYNHNSMSHLSRRLESHKEGRNAVLTEALFSMDGDCINVAGLQKLKKEHGFLCVVDEAHSFGALGDGGRGLARPVADIAVGTMGKAFGFFGAFVLLPEGFKEYLFNFSSPLIYSTTLPEAHAASAIDILKIVAQSDDRREHLHHVSALMKQGLRDEGFTVYGDAHVLAVEIGDEDLAVSVAKMMHEKSIFVFPARYPTVPLHRAILRISMTALHDKNDVERFIKSLKEVMS
jgi:8-amino-7-oxononanoate synthase